MEYHSAAAGLVVIQVGPEAILSAIVGGAGIVVVLITVIWKMFLTRVVRLETALQAAIEAITKDVSDKHHRVRGEISSIYQVLLAFTSEESTNRTEALIKMMKIIADSDIEKKDN